MSNDIDATLSALGDPTRRQVIDLLKKSPMRAGALASAFAISAPALSRHLKVLRRAGLVEERRDESDNRVRLFQLRQAPFVSLHTWLQEIESFWSDQLQAFKMQAEERFQQQVEGDDSTDD
jgi:DNA-binding transcriptional ArsR family regulator